MTKSKKTSNYHYSTDPYELDRRFYTLYDENFLFNKALALACILENEERFRLQAAEYKDIDPTRINDKFFDSLRAEIHFAEMHQFEGFFALLIVTFQQLPDWIYLTAYTNTEMNNNINLYIEGKIKDLTDDKIETDREFILNAVYATYAPEGEGQEEEWNVNLDNITWLIRHMAERYVKGKVEYNSYKHGLRVMTGESAFGFRKEDPPGTPTGPYFPIAYSKDSLSFLQFKYQTLQTLLNPKTNMTAIVLKTTEKEDVEEQPEEQKKQPEDAIRVIKEEDVKRVYQTTKHFNPIESISYLNIMNKLLATIKNTRLAFLSETPLENLLRFNDLDKDQLLALRTRAFETVQPH